MSRSSSGKPPTLRQRLPTNIWVAYLLWLISLGLFVVDFFFGRILIVALAEMSGMGYWQISFFDRLAVVLVGSCAALLTIFAEYYYRMGVEKGLLWPRFLRVTAWQVGVILAAALASQLVGEG